MPLEGRRSHLLPGTIFWQASLAAWKVGLLRSMPVRRRSMTCSPTGPVLGSGKFGTPWERMHWENWSALVFSAALWAGAMFPSGLYFLHACSAAWKVDEWVLMPEAEMALRKPRLGLGSGKSRTPWERMHCANCSCCDWLTSPEEPGTDGVVGPDELDEPGEDAGWAVVVEPDDPDGPDAEAVAVVVPPALATPGLFDPPPQAVARSASAASPTIAAPARRLRARCRFVPSVSWSWPWPMVPPRGLKRSIWSSYSELVVSGRFRPVQGGAVDRRAGPGPG